MNATIKLVIAILLLLCLADMPYVFYQLVRFVTAGAFAYISYDSFKQKYEGQGFVFAALALLFLPFLKVSLGRFLWNVVDMVIAIWLFYLLIKTFKKNEI